MTMRSEKRGVPEGLRAGFPSRKEQRAARLMSRASACAFVLLMPILGAIGGSASAKEVRVPLTIDYVTLTEAFRHELYTAPGGRAALWNGSGKCQFLYAENPALSRADTGVSVETATSLGLGIDVAGKCVSPLTWNGIIEAEAAPYVAAGLRLMLRIQDLNLYDVHHRKTLVLDKGFDLIKRYLIPRLETFSYDLNPAVQQLGALAEAASTPSVADRIRAAVASIRADPAVEAARDGVRITLLVTVPDVPIPVPGATPAPPTQEEIEAFQKQLDNWDAFLVFAVKQLGGAVGDRQFRDDLLQILLSSRYRLVDALGNPPSAAGPDPVRVLFLDTWRQLGDAVRSAARRGQMGSRSLEFLSFISAGDALFALDQAAPALGMRVSADDLRLLAHIMAPAATGDPLQFNFEEDSALKSLMSPSLAPLTSPPESNSSASPTASGSATPTSVAPSATPTSSVSAPKPVESFSFPFWLIEPGDACASETTSIIPQLKEVASRLRKVVVNEGNASEYRSDMERLLDLSIERQLRASSLAPAFQPTFRLSVKSAAWQESCWRQFVRKAGRVTWLESSTGDIGLMQVNKYVWRGFYNIEKLRWDVLYNAGSGTAILFQMASYVVTKQHADLADLDDTALARSVYAAYNGGPNAYNRWRRKRETSPIREIDAAFLSKFRAVARGQAIDILSCAAQWGRSSGH